MSSLDAKGWSVEDCTHRATGKFAASRLAGFFRADEPLREAEPPNGTEPALVEIEEQPRRRGKSRAKLSREAARRRKPRVSTRGTPGQEKESGFSPGETEHQGVSKE
ncbi:MAG: hypothetical protein WBW84_16475 [Acidobacteriaceae bacterium]